MRKLFTTLRMRAAAYRLQVLIGGAALLLLVLIGTVYAILNPTKAEESRISDVTYPSVQLSPSYEDGEYTIRGSVTLKNRCQRLDTSAMLDDSVAPPIIRVDITSEDDEGICLEIPDTREFSVTVEGPEGAEIEIFINGLPLEGDAV